MADIVTPNMGLTLPTISQTVGPTYAVEINNDLSTLDGHNHTPGSGSQIPTSGLNINSDLSFNGVNATTLRSTRFSSQSSVLSLGTDLRCLYSVSADLYYNDGSGNNIRLTQSGGVAGSPGSISGLASPASATYSSGISTFIWQSNVNTPANLDAGSIILRNNTAGSNGLTLSPPSLGTNYTLTLPALPAGLSIMTLDNLGNISAPAVYPIGSTSIATQGVAKTNLAAVGQQQSAGSTFTLPINPGIPVTVGTASVTLTTTGRPVILLAQPGQLSSSSFVIYGTPNIPSVVPNFTFSYTRNGTRVGSYGYYFGGPLAQFLVAPGPAISSGSIYPNTFSFVPPTCIDVIGAGTYTYGMQLVGAGINGSVTYFLQNVSMVAFEL